VSHLPFDFCDFFAGGGMARLGLGERWRCILANDNARRKERAYRTNFEPANEFNSASVEDLTAEDIPGHPLLAWASFPCQDLSLAGTRRGLRGSRSTTFWPFWKLMLAMARQGRPPRLLVLENVVGALTSHGGADFHTIVSTLGKEGYRCGALIMDAVHFVPQSRPRLFVVAARNDCYIPLALLRAEPDPLWHSRPLRRAFDGFEYADRQAWLWWNVPPPPQRTTPLSDIVEDEPHGVEWHTAATTKALLSMMSPVNRAKVRAAQQLGRPVVGTVYKRTRPTQDGRRTQRAEVRFDQVSGCLRTPLGGSSRQTLLFAEGAKLRSRLLSPREAARLMGVPESYRLPERYNEAYHLMGDGLVVPVVSWLERHLLHPLGQANADIQRAA